MDYCRVRFNITEKIPKPSFIYYELENFYTNHREFVKSKLYSQLRGEMEISNKNNSICEGGILMKDIMENENSFKTYQNEIIKGNIKNFNPTEYAIPCGLNAKSFFNDEYELYSSSNKRITIKENGIANEYDVMYLFKNFENWRDKQWLDMENGNILI